MKIIRYHNDWDDHISHKAIIIKDEQFVGEYRIEVTHTEKTTGTLYGVWVNTEFRQLKIGRKLVEDAILKAKELNLEELWLDVRQDNDIAIKLYQSLGFEFREKLILPYITDEEYFGFQVNSNLKMWMKL